MATPSAMIIKTCTKFDNKNKGTKISLLVNILISATAKVVTTNNLSKFSTTYIFSLGRGDDTVSLITGGIGGLFGRLGFFL